MSDSRQQFEAWWSSLDRETQLDGHKFSAIRGWQARETSMYDMTKVYNDVAALLSGSRYMDPPDGGDVEIAEQIRRMIADKVEQAFIAGIAQGRKALPEWTDSMATEQYMRGNK